jgi:hypothetical protein
MIRAMTVRERPDAGEWRDFAWRLMNAAGIGAVGAGVIFFVAANWHSLSVTGRFALVEAAFAACIAAAVWRPPPDVTGRSAIAGAVLFTGALLALFGQTYQTGADVHELFFTWAALALPLAVAGRSGAVWAIWWIVLDVGLVLLIGWLRPRSFGLFGPTWLHGSHAALVPFAANLLGAGVFLAIQRTRFADHAPRWLVRLLFTLAFAFVTTGALDAIFSPGESLMLPVIAVTWVVVAYAALRLKRDVFPLALVAGSAILVSTAFLAHAMKSNELGTFFILTTWVVGTSAAAAFLLMRWIREWGSERDSPQPGEKGEAYVPDPGAVSRPWYISLLMGAAGWLAGILGTIFLAILFNLGGPGGFIVMGLALLVAAYALYAVGREGIFIPQLALAVSVAGQFATIYGLSETLFKGSSSWSLTCFTAFVLQVALAIVMPSAVHRVMSALFACIAWGLALNDFSRTSIGAAALTWLPLAAVVFMLVRTAPSWSEGFETMARPATAGLILGLAGATLFSDPAEVWTFWTHAVTSSEKWLSLWPLLSALAALGALCAAFALGMRGLTAACIVAALLHVSHYYYVMGTTLLVKSLTMIVLGAVLLGAARAVGGRAST